MSKNEIRRREPINDLNNGLHIKVKEASVANINEIESIEKLCFSPEERFDRSLLEAILRNRNFITFIAEVEGSVAGYATMHFSRVSIDSMIVSIAVFPRFRRKGVGTALMRALEKKSVKMGSTRIVLQVNTRNAGALYFYEKLGFYQKCILRDYYGPGIDAFLMEKHVKC
ncbi:MAG: GNAT family N-acetyltransferase [Methanomassiliicoccales archaeon]